VIDDDSGALHSRDNFALDKSSEAKSRPSSI
jgi:hypothetical protein